VSASEMSDSSLPLVYHFTGADIPSWGVVTLKQSAKNWPGPVFLLHDRPAIQPLQGVHQISTDGWYDQDPFNIFAKSFARPQNFREGFWFHAIERFFVLSQWSEFFGEPRFLHTELDVLLMGHNTLNKALPKDRIGVMYPRASAENAGANVLYVNGAGSLTPLLNFFTDRSGEEFEMSLLAQFLDDFPGQSSALPSHLSIGASPFGALLENHIQPEELGGVVDVHPLGTWIFGQDPRNEKHGPVFNHFYYPLIGSEELKEMTFRFDWGEKQLFVTGLRNSEWPVFALHVHSKVMKRAHSRLAMWTYARLANQRWRSLVVIQNLHKRPISLLQSFVDHLYRRVVRPFRGVLSRGQQ